MAFPTQSASLNGTTQGFSAADSVSLSPTSDMTLEGWFKFNSLPGSGVEYELISKHDNGGGANGRSWTWSLFNNAGTMQLFVRISTDGTSANQSTVGFNYTPATATWIHLALSYVASTGVITFTENGVSLGTLSGNKTSIFDSTTVLTLGIRGDLASAPLNGHIGVCRVWKGVALSVATILANVCTVYGSAQTNMSAEWSLNNVLTDASGNSNTLTNLNATTFTADVTGTCASAAAISMFTLLGVGV